MKVPMFLKKISAWEGGKVNLPIGQITEVFGVACELLFRLNARKTNALSPKAMKFIITMLKLGERRLKRRMKARQGVK